MQSIISKTRIQYTLNRYYKSRHHLRFVHVYTLKKPPTKTIPFEILCWMKQKYCYMKHSTVDEISTVFVCVCSSLCHPHEKSLYIFEIHKKLCDESLSIRENQMVKNIAISVLINVYCVLFSSAVIQNGRIRSRLTFSHIANARIWA